MNHLFDTKPFVDSTKPEPEDALAATRLVPSYLYTLKDVVSLLNARQGSGSRMVVDDALAAKTVSVFGLEFAPAQQILAACAQVYGLRVVAEENGKLLRITRPSVRRPRDLSDLAAVVRRALPEPYVRALHFAERDQANAQTRERNRLGQEVRARDEALRREGKAPDAPVAALTPEQQREEDKIREERRARWQRWSGSPAALRQAALRRFRATVEPKVKKSAKGEVSLAELDDAEKSALATALMQICLDGVQGVASGVLPSYLSRFDELLISGKIYTGEDGKRKWEMMLGFAGANSFDAKVGISNADLPEK